MAAYMIAQIEVFDPEEYQKYLAGFMPVFQRYGGELLATSRNTTEVLEGEWAYARTVIMKFPDSEKARSWYADPYYRLLSGHRHNSAKANLVLVDSLDPLSRSRVPFN